jgi:hypothetical protein
MNNRPDQINRFPDRPSQITWRETVAHQLSLDSCPIRFVRSDWTKLLRPPHCYDR